MRAHGSGFVGVTVMRVSGPHGSAGHRRAGIIHCNGRVVLVIAVGRLGRRGGRGRFRRTQHRAERGDRRRRGQDGGRDDAREDVRRTFHDSSIALRAP